MESGNKIATAAIALILGLAVGGGVGYMAGNGMDKDNNSNMANSSQTSETKADGVTVGGAVMVRDKDIVDNAANASNVTTLVSLVQKADLVETLKGAGPFTVFGPDNDEIGRAHV